MLYFRANNPLTRIFCDVATSEGVFGLLRSMTVTFARCALLVLLVLLYVLIAHTVQEE